MRFISPALKRLLFPALSRSGYLRYAAGVGPAVVTYHGVLPDGYVMRNDALDGHLVHASSLREQLRLLKSRYHVLSPDDFLRWSAGELSLPPRSILLTCDDALRNTLTEMLPILLEMGVSCLFFATGASADAAPSMLWYEELYLMLLDARGPVSLSILEADICMDSIRQNQIPSHWWNLVQQFSRFDRTVRRKFLDQIRDQLALPSDWAAAVGTNSTTARRFLTLDRDELRRLAAAGMGIGSQSLSHPVLARVSDDLAWLEISESKRVLEEALEQTVWAFGYPFGNSATVTERELHLAERAGFRCAFMNVGGGLGAKNSRFALPRVHVTADMTLSEFEAHISGFYRALRQRLMGHNEMDALLNKGEQLS